MNRRVDFKKVKQEVSMGRLLEHYELLDGLTVKGKSLKGECPFCDSDTLSVSPEKNAWQCFSCKKSGNVLDFAGYMEEVEAPRQAALFLAELFSVGESRPARRPKGRRAETPKPKEEAKVPEVKPEPEEPAAPLPEKNPELSFTLKSIDYEHELIEELDLPEEVIREFDVGYFTGKGMFKERIVFPIRDLEGCLVAYGGVSSGRPGEYHYPPKYHRAIDLFNAHRGAPYNEQPLIVVEEPLDVMGLAQYGTGPAVALMGQGIHDRQLEVISRLVGQSGRVTLFLSRENPQVADIVSKLIAHVHVRLVRFKSRENSFVRFGEKDTTEVRHFSLTE